MNPHLEDVKRSIWDFVLWKAGRYDDPKSKEPAPKNFSYPATPEKYIHGEPTAIWIGHSTYLIEVNGTVILTDPVWHEYCSPIPIQILRRKEQPAIALKDLPRVDIVILSHNHYDHLDARTVAYLKKCQPQIQWVVPAGMSRWFKRRSINKVTELSWWETSEDGKECKVTAVPAQHFSGRALWDKNRTHWNGYVVEKGNKKLYFSGDTGYNPNDFKQIGKYFGVVDLSLIPIGTYAPKKFMQPVHINPSEAVQIHQDVNSRFSLGMHWNTFKLSEEPLDRPPYDLFLAMKEKSLPFESFLPNEIGMYVNF